MNYTLHQLQVFLKVSQLESITKASEELNLSQPAVSIQLKNFQDQFEIPLTEVIGRKIYITDFGKEVALAAENIINEVYSINYKSSAFKGKLSGRLKISIVSTAKYVMPYFISDFINKHEDVELFLDVTNKNEVIKNLENNEIDFSMVSILPEKMSLNFIELMDNKLFLIGNPKMIRDFSPEEIMTFKNHPLVYRETGSGTREIMEKYLNKYSISVAKKIELKSNEAVKQAVIAGLGYSIMPLIGLKSEIQNGDLAIIPMQGLPITSKWHLVWLPKKKLSPVATAFLEYINSEKEAIIAKNFKWTEKY
jgi:DNA-binding transcriptional LysR family regulator